MKNKIAASLLACCMLVPLSACGKEDMPATESETQAETKATAEQTETRLDPETAWLGRWDADDTDEHFEIYEVTDTGLKVRYNHYTEGSIELFDYDMEFENDDHTEVSEIGDAADKGGWEYAFILGDGIITVKSQFPDQIFRKTS